MSKETVLFDVSGKNESPVTSLTDMSFTRALPTHVGGVCIPHDRSAYVGWHHFAKDINDIPTDEKVLPGMTVLEVSSYTIYKFSDDREWLLDIELTALYQRLVAVG